MTFADALDMTYAIKRDLQVITGSLLSFKLMTESLSSFDVLEKSFGENGKEINNRPTDRQTLYNGVELSEKGYVRFEHNATDALTKVLECTSRYNVLSQFMFKYVTSQSLIKLSKR